MQTWGRGEVVQASELQCEEKEVRSISIELEWIQYNVLITSKALGRYSGHRYLHRPAALALRAIFNPITPSCHPKTSAKVLLAMRCSASSSLPFPLCMK